MYPRVPGHVVLSVVRLGPDDLLLRAARQRDGATVLIQTHADPAGHAAALARYRQALELGRRLDTPQLSRALELLETPDRAALIHPGGDASLLNERIPPGGLPLSEFIAIAASLTEAVVPIHRARLIHGDLRPSSVLLRGEALHATLLDLGCAMSLDDPPRESAGPTAKSRLSYIAPEQTGRVALRLDQRADLYALGCTFFELLCGRPPFLSDDALELVHCHIAQVAPSVRELRPDVPPIIGAIVAKLLAKAPDDRYQSCPGLLADLHRCREYTARGEPIPPFELGSDDAHARFVLPEKLYGRESELAQVLDAFARASQGQAELLVVAGPPGVGKSALVATVEPHVTETGGLFVSGKFDQLGLNTPYSAVKRAFGDLMQRLLGEREERIQLWKSQLLDALGTQGRILTDLIPDLERIIGPQAPIEAVGPIEAHRRFTMLFRRFVQVFARPEHPLVVFLDDWQWADMASMELIQDIVAAPDTGALLLIGAYRETELSPAHPAYQIIERMSAASVTANKISIPPLGLQHLESFVKDALRCPEEHGRPLAAAVAERSGGNPFFARSFLHVLYETGVLFRVRGGGFRCDLQRLKRETTGETVIELVVARIERLPRATGELLQLAACLGSEFRSGDLAVAGALDDTSVASALAPAVESGLVLRGPSAFRFVHDRVQEAAYTSLPAPDRRKLHLTIGRRLLARVEREGCDERLAEAVEQLNAGRSLVLEHGERLELSQLNLRAARRAREATAYASAARHAAVGIELLAEDGFSSSYPLALDLHALCAESAYLSGQFATAEALYEVALRHARTHLDRIRILSIKKDQFELQGRYLDAISVLRDGLALVGITFPDDDADLSRLLRAELEELPRNLAGRSIASLIDAPEIVDPTLIATLHLLMGMWPSCYVAGLPRLLTVVSLKIANFCLANGNCEVTSAAYVNYSFVAGFVTGNYAAAYEFGQLGIALSERYPNRSVRAWCYFLFGCGTAIWRRPLSECTPYLERSFELGMESGSLASACYACSYIVTDAFFQGMSLAEVETLYMRYAEFLARNNPAIHVYLELGIRSMRRLVGRDRFDEVSFLNTFQQNRFLMAAHRFGELEAAYHLDDPERARMCADAASKDVTELLSGIYKVPETALFAALAWLAASERAQANERASLKDAAEQQLAYLRQLANECEESYLHKALLVEAELARVEGRADEAALLFEQAAEAAARAGFQQHAALASELAARLWRDRGFPKAARAYLEEAYEGYRRWGATAKLRVLEARYPDLLPARVLMGSAAFESWPGSSPEPLDVISVTKASQAISREIELDALLGRLMRVMLENAGARRGALVLVEGDALRALACAEGVSVSVESATPLEAPAHVIESIVRYVARTGETVLLDDAMHEGRFVRDPEVRRRRARSVLCVPLRLKDRVMGAVYLENELSAGAFTPTRARVLELLAGQAAISLENARLYSDLRTASLAAEAANRAKDEFLAILGHELRNPLAPILTACHLMAMRSPDQLERERGVIERQVKHMMRLVDDLLDASRIAQGKIDIVRKSIDLSDVVREAVEIVTPLIERRATPVEVHVPELPLPVYADPVRLTQVLSNVLSNAVKFSEPGSAVSIVLGLEDERAVVRVRDRGAGIPAELLPRIFELFVQGSQPGDRAIGGLGLGLTIAKNLVELHDGSISAHSDGPGRGSEFCIRLPLDTGATNLSAADAAVQARRAGPSRRVLVVDDNVDAALLLMDLLEDMGHEVRVTHDGPSALVRLRDFHPDVALLDVGLPVMDGFELARRIRETRGRSAPQLIAVSGYAPSHRADQDHLTVFDDYVVKPISVERLQQVLRVELAAPKS